MEKRSKDSSQVSFQLDEVDTIPEGWQVTELHQLADITYGVQAAVANLLDESLGIPILTNINITNFGELDLSKLRYYELPNDKYNKLLLKEGDILFNWRSGSSNHVGKTALFNIDAPYTFSSFILRFRANERINNIFLLYYLQYLKGNGFFVQKRSQSSVNSVFNASVAAHIPVFVPSLPEQSAIAHTLRTIQKAKEARQRELELERERKAALMQYLFTYGTCNEPSKKTKIGEIPQSWRIVMLGDLCLNGLGIIQTGPFGSQLHASDYKSAGIPVVNPTHLRFNSIVDDAIPRISREKADSLSKHYLIEGDILISRRGDFSRYSYISQKYSGWFCGTGCLLIRLTHPEVDNYFLSILFSTEVIQNYLKLNAVGSIMPNLNTRILQDVPLTLPKIDQQREIAEVLRSCDRKITALEQEAAFLDELFRAMLEELMTGRLSVLALVEKDVMLD